MRLLSFAILPPLNFGYLIQKPIERINMPTRDELIKQAAKLLSSTRSRDRMRGAKLVSKHLLAELSKQLYAAFLRELKDARTWETKSEMIRALGLINFAPALEQIAPIVQANSPRDAITHSATAAYVRLTRKDVNDASEIIRLVKPARIR